MSEEIRNLWYNFWYTMFFPIIESLQVEFIILKRIIMNRITKIICMMGFVALFLYACSAQRSNTSPSAASWRSGVKGQWTLNAIEKENFPTNTKVKSIFDEAPIDCFHGSTWNLTGSGKGTITFSNDGDLCAPGAVREIFWSIN